MTWPWHIYCRTCDSTHEFRESYHETELICALIEYASEIASLYALSNDRRVSRVALEISTNLGKCDISWFKEHANHVLVPRNACGDFLVDDFIVIRGVEGMRVALTDRDNYQARDTFSERTLALGWVDYMDWGSWSIGSAERFEFRRKISNGK